MAPAAANNVSLVRIGGFLKALMLQSTTELQVILQLAPDWAPYLTAL